MSNVRWTYLSCSFLFAVVNDGDSAMLCAAPLTVLRGGLFQTTTPAKTGYGYNCGATQHYLPKLEALWISTQRQYEPTPMVNILVCIHS